MTKAASSRPLVLYNARLLDPDRQLDSPGAIVITGETITAGHKGITQPDGHADAIAIDCQGLCLAPGLIDLRVVVPELGEPHKETVDSASLAAVHGGVTGFAAVPDIASPMDRIEHVGYIRRRAREVALSKIYPVAALTQSLMGKDMAEMGLLAEAGAVAFSDGWGCIDNSNVMRQIMTYASGLQRSVIHHPQDPNLSAQGVMNEGALATRLGLSGICAQAEAMIVERDIRLLELTGGHYHAAHLSCAAAIDVIARAKTRGLSVTCDTAPPYFSLNELDVADYRTYSRLDPPLRAEIDRQAVIEGLRHGVIDAIASDHVPQDTESKRLPFEQALPGAVGLETLLPLSLGLVHDSKIDLLDVLTRLIVAPAKVLNLPIPGLGAGQPADIILFDLGYPWLIKAENFVSKSHNTPFDRRSVQGRVVMTMVDGRCLYCDPDSIVSGISALFNSTMK